MLYWIMKVIFPLSAFFMDHGSRECTDLIYRVLSRPSAALPAWTSGSAAGQWCGRPPSLHTGSPVCSSPSPWAGRQPCQTLLSLWIRWGLYELCWKCWSQSKIRPSLFYGNNRSTLYDVGSAPHLIVVDLMLSPLLTRLYACHMSSGSSGISTTCLETRRHDRTGALPGQFQVKAGETHPVPFLSRSRCTSFMAWNRGPWIYLWL